MNRLQAVRRTAPHMVIALALCAGAWMALVRPKLHALAAAKHERAEVASHLTPEQQWRLVQAIEETEAWLIEIELLNELSRDSSRLYSAIMELAEARKVTVRSVQPGPAVRQSAVQRGRDESDARVAVNRLEIVMSGPFEQIASLFDDIADFSPFIRPQWLVIAPVVDQPPIVTARLICDILSFTAPSELAPLKGTGNAP